MRRMAMLGLCALLEVPALAVAQSLTVTISTNSSAPVTGPFPIAIAFSAPVTGFALSDISIVNGNASHLVGSGDRYAATVTPVASGELTINIAPGAAEDSGGNPSTAANPLSITVHLPPLDDCGKPRGQPGPAITAVSPVLVTRGDAIAIVGQNLFSTTHPTTVEIDCQQTYFTFDQQGRIQVPAIPTPNNPDDEAALTRQVIIEVGGNRSEPAPFVQLTWHVICTPRVLFSWLLYIGIVAWIGRKNGAAVFKSTAGGWSLSKTQMALWTFVISFSYVTLAAARVEFLDISQGLLWLMGISSATAVGAKFSSIAKQRRIGGPLTPSGFLTTGNPLNSGVLALHRCQIAVWTVVSVCIYVWVFTTTMRLPDVPLNLVALMGISGGTYVSFHRS